MNQQQQAYTTYKNNISLRDYYISEKETNKIFLFNLESMKNNGFDPDSINLLDKQVKTKNEILENQLNISIKEIYNTESKKQNFVVNILFNNTKHIYISLRNNKDKDLYGYYQVVGGKVENNESNEQSAIRETEEESGILIENNKLIFICYDEYFSNENILYECVIFATCIGDQIPKQTESDKQDEWFPVTLNEFEKKYKLTPSLVRQMESIKKIINNHKNIISKKKKRKLNSENEDKNDNNSEKSLELDLPIKQEQE